MSGSAVKTRPQAAPTGSSKLPGVETFAPGTYPGDKEGETLTYSDQDLREIARNFELLSKGKTPLHRVPVVVTHDGVHAYGWVEDAEYDGTTLFTDWEEVEPKLRQLIRSGRLKKVSAELKQDFTDRDGKVYPGQYLYRVTVLGADVPRVKGLADLPQSFADQTPGRRFARLLKFAEASPMNREQAVAFLTQMGLDPQVMGADVPDAFLIAVATAWQEEENLEPAAHADADNPPPTPPAVTTPAAANPKKVTVSQTFSDPRELSRFIRREISRATAPALKSISDAAAAETAAREQRAAEERQGAVRLFCDQRAKEGKISPADNDEKSPLSVRSSLLRLAAQPPVTHKFADPAAPGDRTKDTAKTELQLQFEAIDARPPRQFSERVRQGAGGSNSEPDYATKVKDYWKARAERRGAASASNSGSN